jgi:hypothetical protein
VEVVSGVSGKAEVGVKVVFSDRRQRFDDKTATTDANGLLSVFLPEGDWAVRIDEGTAAQNKTYDAVTSSGGKFMDPSGRAIYSLRLSR